MDVVEARITRKDGSTMRTTARNHYELFRKLEKRELHQMKEIHTITIPLRDMRQGRETRTNTAPVE